MDSWVRYWSVRVSVVGACLTLVAGPVLGVSFPVMFFRALVVGAVLYVAVRVMGGLVGRALLWVALAEQEQLESRRQASRAGGESDDDEQAGDVEVANTPDVSADGVGTEGHAASEKVAA